MSTPKTTDTPIHIEGSDQFDELVIDSAVVLMDYHADRCGPCKVLEPTAKEAAEETNTVVAKADVNELQGLAHEQGARSVPILQSYVGGEQIKEVIGVQSKEDLTDVIETIA